jgi:hypothetical protein
VGTQSDICDGRYLTEPDIGIFDIRLRGTESNIMPVIGFNFLLNTDMDIAYLKLKQFFSSYRDAPLFVQSDIGIG